MLQSSHDIDPTIPVPVCLIATAFVLALVLAGMVSVRYSGDQTSAMPTVRLLSGWYLILALIGLVGAIVWSRGAIFSADKVQALKEDGYLYVLFEIAASLARISAVMEGRWRIVAGGFGGVVIAFYINRNDLHYTLVMLRQIALVFIGTYTLSAIAAKARGAIPWI